MLLLQDGDDILKAGDIKFETTDDALNADFEDEIFEDEKPIDEDFRQINLTSLDSSQDADYAGFKFFIYCGILD